MQPFSLGARYLAFVKTVGSPDQDDEVWLYDLVEGTSARLGTTIATSRSVSLQGDVLTWATRGAAGQNDGYEPADVIVYRISTGTTRTLATVHVPGPYPKTDGRFVVWDTYQGDLREIQAYDLDTDRLIDVSHDLFLNFTPEIGDGIVVWERGGELDSEIMAHDLLSGETTQLSDNRVYMDQLSQASGRTVVWWMYWWADTPGVDRFMVASAPLSAEEPFQDVEGTHRYRTAILGLYERGISGGYLVGSDRFFRPEAPLLRAQFAKMVCQALHVPVTEDMDAPFTDLGARRPGKPLSARVRGRPERPRDPEGCRGGSLRSVCSTHPRPGGVHPHPCSGCSLPGPLGGRRRAAAGRLLLGAAAPGEPAEGLRQRSTRHLHRKNPLNQLMVY